MTQRPQRSLGLRHVALFVREFEDSLAFYTELLGMDVEWQPDSNNVYLSSQGADNLALHRWTDDAALPVQQRLDHIGFIVQSMALVDEWHDFLHANEVVIVRPPKTHRDGARSFYCKDPDGTLVQVMYHPPISDRLES
ncbi:MAG: VOC family protein [Pseudomonadota bacterium]